jgi:hypothetical protein
MEAFSPSALPGRSAPMTLPGMGGPGVGFLSSTNPPQHYLLNPA